MARRFTGAGLSRRPARTSTTGTTAPYVGPLDTLSVVPNGWWDFARRDFAAYTGPLCRVDRASDGALIDVYALADGWLDTAAIVAHCTGTTGRLNILYDQSGNGRNWTIVGGGVANQPVVYAAGALTVLGTKPSASFANSQYLERSDACGLTGATAYTLVTVAVANSYDLQRRPLYFGLAVPTANGHQIAQVYGSATTILAKYGAGTTPASQTFGSGFTSGVALTPHYTIQALAAGAQVGNGTLEVNGVAATETAENVPTTVLALLNESSLLGARRFVASGAISNLFLGRITAAGLWGSVLSAGDLTLVRAACAGLIV